MPIRVLPRIVGATLVLSTTALIACDKPADQAACEKMVEHDYGILDERNHMTASPEGKKLFDELKKKTLDACVGKMKTSVVECHMKAPTPAEMSACDKDGK